MSADGSAFADGGGGQFLQEPSSKRSKFESQANVVDSAHIMEDISGEPNNHIPVPQSDFEIVINSSSQETTSPPSEIALSTEDLGNAGITIVGQTRSLSEMETSLASSSSHAAETTIPLTEDSSITSAAELTTLTANGREALLSSITQSAGIGDLGAGGQFLLPSSGVDSNQSSGPLYVMIPPSGGAELIQAAMQQGSQQRPLIPRISAGLMPGSPVEENKSAKEYLRKQTHNEVERRRRDRINELIKTLAEIVPGCQKKDAASGNIVGYVYSKGTVLEKTVEYLKELLVLNEQLSTTAKLAEKSSSALQVLQNQITVLEKENSFLRTQMIQLGIDNTAGLNARSLLSSPLAQSLLNSQAAAAAASPPVPTTTQLLVSLAQTLSANPLLASLAQNTAALQAAAAAATAPAAAASPSIPPPPPTSTPPQISQPLQAQLNSSSSAHQVMNTLVQSLASIATTNTSPSQAPTPPNLTAAASLINSLIMAQNALANTSTSPSDVSSHSTTGAAANVNLAASVLSAVAEAAKDKTPTK